MLRRKFVGLLAGALLAPIASPGRSWSLDCPDFTDRVKKIVIEHLGVDAAKVTADASFIDDLGADSLDTVELVMAFEEEFGLEIPDEAAEEMVTVGDAIRVMQELCTGTRPPSGGSAGKSDRKPTPCDSG